MRDDPLVDSTLARHLHPRSAAAVLERSPHHVALEYCVVDRPSTLRLRRHRIHEALFPSRGGGVIRCLRIFLGSAAQYVDVGAAAPLPSQIETRL